MVIVWGIFRNSSNFIKQWLPWSISNYSTTHEYCWKSEKQIHRKSSRTSWDSNQRHLLNTSQTLLPLIKSLGPLGRGVEDKLHRQQCPEASAKFQLILALSELNWTQQNATIFRNSAKYINILECLLLHTVNNIKLASEVTQSLSAVVPQSNIVILPLCVR